MPKNNPKDKNSGKPKKANREPIYVSDPNDPRLKAYNDSLDVYNSYINAKKYLEANNYKLEIHSINQKKNKDRYKEADSWDGLGAHKSTTRAKDYLKNADKLNSKYKKVISKDKYEVRDMADDMVNNNLPMQLFNKNISPASVVEYADRKEYLPWEDIPNYYDLSTTGKIQSSIFPSRDIRPLFNYSNANPVQPVKLNMVDTPSNTTEPVAYKKQISKLPDNKVKADYLPPKGIPNTPERDINPRIQPIPEAPKYQTRMKVNEYNQQVKQYLDNTGKVTKEEYYDMKGNKLPTMMGGGIFNNYLRAMGDIPLTALGMGNVISDDEYKGAGAQGMRKAAGIAGGVAGAALPMAANMIAPGSGALIGIGQQVLGQFNPQQPQQGMYPMGGMTGPNAELEMQENTLNPDGSTIQLDAPSHAQGGAKLQLDPGTLVFSDRLKMGKKTFAELNKPNMTKKEDKILNDPKATATAKITADLMRAVKNKASVELFQKQEQVKAEKVAKYAGRVGYKMPYGGQLPKYDGLPGSNSIVPTYGPFQSQDHYNSFNMLSTFNSPIGRNDTPSGPVVPQQNLANSAGVPIQTTGSPSGIFQAQQSPNVQNGIYNNPINTNQPAAGGGMNPEIAKQLALGIGQNVGNLYDLYRSRPGALETERYGRVKPTLLDPSQAISDNNTAFKQGDVAAREASVGNSAAYLNSRRAMLAQKMMANSRIRKEYDNMNAGIKNQASFYNNDVDRTETIANAQNQAQARNIRSNAFSKMGQNTMGQVGQNNMATRDKEYLMMIAKTNPEVIRDPEIRKYLGLD